MSIGLAIKKPLKAIVRGLAAVLPESLFTRLYDLAFPGYRYFVRTAYLLRGWALYAFRDPERWMATKRIHRVMPHSLVGAGGLEATLTAARSVLDAGVPGDFVELGVAQGGCAALLGSELFSRNGAEDSRRKLWLFDSYEGLPDPTADDLLAERGAGTGDHVRPLPRGSCLGTLEEVQVLTLGEFGFPEERVEFVRGWFQDTLPTTRDTLGAIAILRIDGDWYESTKCCLQELYDKVSAHGIVIIDDYYSCYGCEKAVDEFIEDRDLDVELVFDGRGGCWFEKPVLAA